MTEDIIQRDNAAFGIQPGCHRPFHITGIANVHIIIDHGDDFQRRKSRKRSQNRLFAPAGAFLGDLHHCMIKTAATVAEIHIFHAGHLPLQQRQYIRLAQQTDRVPHFRAGNNGLENRFGPMMNCFDMHHRTRFAASIIAGDFGKWTFVIKFAGDHFAFQCKHGIGDQFHRIDLTWYQCQRRALKLAGDTEFVGIRRGCFGRCGGGKMQPWPDPDIDRNGQALAALPGFIKVQFQMPSGVDIDVQSVFINYHEALD